MNNSSNIIMEKIGTVEEVDGLKIFIKIDSEEKLRKIRAKDTIAVQGSYTGQHYRALVTKIFRNACVDVVDVSNNLLYVKETVNIAEAEVFGTHYDKAGLKINVFKLTVETFPKEGAECYLMEGRENWDEK